MLGRAILIVALLAAHAAALDQPLMGTRLVLKHGNTGDTMTFVSADPSLVIPAVGGLDDPKSGTPGGVIIDLFTGIGATSRLAVPAGAGWKAKSGAAPVFKFATKTLTDTPVRNATLKQGTTLKIVAAGHGLPLTGGLHSVGIRVTAGAFQWCAFFDAESVRREAQGLFVARGAAVAPADCSDASLFGPCDTLPYPSCGGTCASGAVCGSRGDFQGCRCIAPTEPCEATFGVCNGTCPTGQTCETIGAGGTSICRCITNGRTPCGGRLPACGGDCGPGEVCRGFNGPSPISGSGCTCSDPGPCGGGGLDCPAATVCTVLSPGTTASCIPIPCGSDFPTCGSGGCPPGFECAPVRVSGSGFCFCGTAGAACDQSCGGFDCPVNEVCGVASGGAGCSCAP